MNPPEINRSKIKLENNIAHSMFLDRLLLNQSNVFYITLFNEF